MSFDDLRKQSLAVQEQQAAAEPQSLLDRMPLFKDLDPKQRFTIALLLFINVVILGFGCLLVTERMMP